MSAGKTHLWYKFRQCVCMRVRMIIVSCRRPFAVRPLLLLLAGIRSKIVPPSQYTHHNRLLYPLLRFKTLPNAYRINVRTRGTSSISTLRPNLTRVSCCTLYEAMLILETPDTLTSTYCSRNTTLWKLTYAAPKFEWSIRDTFRTFVFFFN